MNPPIPDPALVVLVGVAGSGKSTWAAAHAAQGEVVSSDALREAVGSGPADLEASADAFAVLDLVVAARLRRGLRVVVDTLGLEQTRRLDYLAAARDAGVPAICVLVQTPPAECRRRNARRDRPVPAAILTAQQRRFREVAAAVETEGWDAVERVDGGAVAAPEPAPATAVAEGPLPPLVLQISRFPWGADPRAWLLEVATAAEDAGIGGIALMDHLVQIPQVGRAWDPIPDPYVTLGMIAATTSRLRLGTLVSPFSFRAPGLVAKAVATLDTFSGGRAFCGVGAGWFAREHAGFGLPFPATGERVDALAGGIQTLRALWSPGTKPFAGAGVALPETTCYPRPVSEVPIVVGGAGPRVLRTAVEHADAVNVRSADLPGALAVLEAAERTAGRTVARTVLDTPVVGVDADDVARRVERLRGGRPAVELRRRLPCGTVGEHRARLDRLREDGMSTVFVSLPDLDAPADVTRVAALA